MRNYIKRSLSLLLAASILFLVPAAAFAYDYNNAGGSVLYHDVNISSARWEKIDGVYVQQFTLNPAEGTKTTFQTGLAYSDYYAVPADSVMVYSTNSDIFSSWENTGDYTMDMMLAVNRADSDYLDSGSGHWDEIQMNSEGKYLTHGEGDGDGSYYMVPTMNLTEYLWEHIDAILAKYNLNMLALEEPEMWYSSGYSEAFKREWADYYNEEWRDPASSADAMLCSMRLKAYLFERSFKTIGERVAEKYPETSLFLATHSTVNYNTWNIISGFNHYLDTGFIDGVIGQSWSDTVKSNFPCSGDDICDEFVNGYLEYASFTDSVCDKSFYALADPMSDGGFAESYSRKCYRHCLAAQLMQPSVQRFEILPWVERAFGNVSGSYRTIQLNMYSMLNDIAGKDVSLTAGTPGISYLLSDSVSWIKTGRDRALSSSDGVYGICMPLIYAGIPLGITAMDQLDSIDDLSNVRVLIVSYDNQLPLDNSVNETIAEWVKNGGTLLYMSGENEYWGSDSQCWSDCGSPLNQLLNDLGLDKIKTQAFSNYKSPAKKLESFAYGKDINFEKLYNKLIKLQNLLFKVFDTLDGIVPALKPLKLFSLLSVVTYLPDILRNRTLVPESILSDSEIKREIVGADYSRFATTFSGSDNVLMRLGGRDVCVEENVGDGHVILCGLPSAYFTSSDNSAQIVKALSKYAVGYTELDYIESNLFKVKRGDYIIAHALKDSETLSGNFIDLYDNELTVKTHVAIEGGDDAVLLDISGLDLSVPRLAFTGGTLDTEVSESAEQTAFTIRSASRTCTASRLVAGQGLYPVSVSAQNSNGESYTGYSLICEWDENSNSLLILSDGDVGGVTITVEWGDTLSDSVYTDMKIVEGGVQTNNRNHDSEYIYKNTAYANAALRFCDLGAELIYKFDISEMNNPLYRFNIAQNYICELSSDAENWIMIADYSQGGTVPHLKTGGNDTVLNVMPSDYGFTDIFYFRIRNSDPSLGWGGSIYSIEWFYIA